MFTDIYIVNVFLKERERGRGSMTESNHCMQLYEGTRFDLALNSNTNVEPQQINQCMGKTARTTDYVIFLHLQATEDQLKNN